MLEQIIIAAAVVGGTGLLIGLLLGVAGQRFGVEENPVEAAVLAELPGNNCGGCGYPGCAGCAAAIASGEADVGACPVGGPAVAAKIAAIMGVEAGEQRRMVAFVMCAGTRRQTYERYAYTGVPSCSVARLMPDSGPKSCSFGCLGFGECVEACPFDAIRVIEGVAVVNKERCRACGRCLHVCPQQLIELVPYDTKVSVKCHSNDRGKHQMDACKVGCIGCKKCERACEAGAITVTNNLAHIDHDLCVGCGVCARECPRGIIVGYRADPEPEKKSA